MSRSILFSVLAVTAIITSAFVNQARSQEGPPPPPPDSGGSAGGSGGTIVISEGPGGEHRRIDPEQMKKRFEEMRKQMSEEMRKQMGATEDEWKVLEPRIQKVQELSMQSRFGGMRMRFRLPGAAENEKPTAVESANKDLQKALDNKDAKPDEIKKALAAYRDARDKARKEAMTQYEKAQKDLREMLTQRQEAYLVMRQILE